jgi:DNA-binding CsgD family transcriptional regulator
MEANCAVIGRGETDGIRTVSITQRSRSDSEVPRSDPAVRKVESLIRQLVELARRDGDLDEGPVSDDEQVLLDEEVEGARWLLVRLPKTNRPQVTLSPREHEIARLVAKGHQNKAIAAVLDISVWTVCTHLRRIFAKFGVSTRAAMVARLGDFDVVRERTPQRQTDGSRCTEHDPLNPHLSRRAGDKRVERP